MTTVWISHNPFLVETEIIIDGIPIAETSRLYKYIKTPMQNWVGSFLPTLVEHCNDDELSIIFKGLPHNYEDLEIELKVFLEKNRDHEIELQFDACPSQFERLETLNAITAEMNNQSHLPELPSLDIYKAPANSLAVLVFGGNNIRRSQLIGSLSKHSSVSDKFCPLSISELDSDYEAVEQSITSDEHSILICLLDENTGSKSNAKIMNLISDSYKVRSKFHKWRFIFVADNPQYAKRILSSDFAIKNADVYASDDQDSIFRRIDEYRSEVCLVHQLTDSTGKLAHRLSDLKQTLDTQAEQDKQTEGIDALEQKALRLVDACFLTQTINKISNEEHIESFLTELCRDFSDFCGFTPNQASYISEINAIKRVNKYVCQNLPQMIRSFLEEQAAKSGYSVKLDIKQKETNCNAKTAASILRQFGCDSILHYITDFGVKDVFIPISNHPAVQGALFKIKVNIIRVPRSTFLCNADFVKLKNDFSGRCSDKNIEASSEIVFDYFDGLRALVCKNLCSSSYMSSSKKSHCKDIFRAHIATIKPVLKEYLKSCQSSAAEEFSKFQKAFDEAHENTKQQIQAKSNEMRKNAQISEEQKKRLAYVQQLLDQTKALTKL